MATFVDPITGQIHEVVDRGLRAEDHGVSARQLARQEDINLGVGKKDLRGDAPGDVIGREQRENERFVQNRRKIMEILGDQPDVAPVRQTFAVQKKRGGMSIGDLAQGLTNADIRRVIEYDRRGVDPELMAVLTGSEQKQRNTPPLVDSGGNQMIREHIVRKTRPAPSGAWKVLKESVTLKNGNTIPVFVVSDPDNGFEFKKPFRIEEPAQRIAAILNQSGNMNDPRVKVIMEAYEKYKILMQEIGTVRKAIKEGQTDKKARLQVLQSQLEIVNGKLGL